VTVLAMCLAGRKTHQISLKKRGAKMRVGDVASTSNIYQAPPGSTREMQRPKAAAAAMDLSASAAVVDRYAALALPEEGEGCSCPCLASSEGPLTIAHHVTSASPNAI